MGQDNEKGLQVVGASTNLLQMNPDIAREVAEVQGMILVAKNCPRDEVKNFDKAVTACTRMSMAEQAQYAFKRGSTVVSGPTIRLLENIALCWGNIKYGVKEITTNDDETKYEAFAWDMENNLKATRTFTQRHGRYTRANGFTVVEDPRDVYEVVMSVAMRRVRACLQEVIPPDLVEACVKQSDETLKGNTKEPLIDRIRKMVSFFEELSVNQAMIEGRLGHKLDSTTEAELIQLRKIYKSIADGMSKPDAWFNIGNAPVETKTNEATQSLNDAFKTPAAEEKKPEEKEEKRAEKKSPWDKEENKK